MNNYEIADHFSLLSKLMEVHGEDSFKAKSYSSAAFNIERLPGEIETMDDGELFNIRGIGASTGKKIRELLATGKLPQLETLLSITPPGILDIMQLKGLGPKKVGVIWKELAVETVGELEYACNENRLAALKGFGAKTQENILQQIAYQRQNEGFHLWAETEAIAAQLITQLRQAFADSRFELTGDIRRQNEVVEFIEIVTDARQAQLITAFGHTPDVTFTEEADSRLLVQVPAQPRIRFHLTTAEAFYHTLFLTTGSSGFITAFLHEYSIPVSPESEQQIFENNQLVYIPPALRETENILSIAKQGTFKQLIQPQDVKGIIHSHSTWSDGVDTIAQMARAAMEKGFEYLVISDHSQAAFYASGLSPERIAAQHQEIDALNEKLAPFKIFKSIEADILNDGSLDYTPRILQTFDLVIASVHSNLKMSLDKAMDRVLTAVKNPFTTILGHPTGRLLLSRQGYPLDHKAIIDACAENKVVIEINAHPRRLDIDWRWIEYALEKGVLLSIDPDAHSINGFKDVYYGVMVAQKGGLTAQHNLSSFSLRQFEAYLQQYHQKKSTAATA